MLYYISIGFLIGSTAGRVILKLPNTNNRKEKNTMRLNTEDFAKKVGVSYVVAAGLLKHLVSVGKAVLVDKVKHKSGKGKPTSVYELGDSVTLDLKSEVSEAA